VPHPVFPKTLWNFGSIAQVQLLLFPAFVAKSWRIRVVVWIPEECSSPT
jgi:hypothetical protein